MRSFKSFWLIILIASTVAMSGCFSASGPPISRTYSLEICVKDSHGIPVEDAVVEIVSSTMDSKKTNDKGIVKFDGLSSVVEILVTKDGYIRTSKSFTVNQDRTEPVELKTKSDPEAKPIITTATVPDMPSSLIDNPLSSQVVTILSQQNDGWGRYQVIPQIGLNYNSWLEYGINRLLDNMLAIQPGDVSFTVEGHSTSIEYEMIDHPTYDLRLVFTLETGDVQAVFYRNNAGNELRLIIKNRYYHIPAPDGRYEKEIRELIFSDNGSEKHAIVLFFRKDAVYSNGNRADMNDIVEIWESGDEKQVKCVRVYGLSEPWEEKIVMHFAGITDLGSSDLPTTGMLFDNLNSTSGGLQEVHESPAIFNERDNLVAILDSDDEVVEGYPSAYRVLDVYHRGVDHYAVQEALIIPETLESNLFGLTR